MIESAQLRGPWGELGRRLLGDLGSLGLEYGAEELLGDDPSPPPPPPRPAPVPAVIQGGAGLGVGVGATVALIGVGGLLLWWALRK